MRPRPAVPADPDVTRPAKDRLDTMVHEAVERAGSWCHRCYQPVRVLEIICVSRGGMLAARIDCEECCRSWGVGVGNNLFWREED